MFPFRQLRTRRFRLSLASLLLVVFAAGVIGLPIVPTHDRSSGRFPCEQRSCGCSNADHCWDKCCCFSDQEKLAWAAKQGVRPPDFLLARVAKKRASIARLPLGGKQLLDKKQPASACCHCTKKVDPNHDDANQAELIKRLRPLALEDAARCRGVEMFWSVLSQWAAGDAPALAAMTDPSPPWRFRIANYRAKGRSFAPEPPVP